MNSTDAGYVLDLTPEDYQKATVEVAFLLDAFASTIDNIMGGNTAPVGRIAGRDTAKKLPLELVDPSLQEIVAALAESVRQRTKALKIRNRKTQDVLLTVTVSAGVASLDAGDDAVSLIARADAALYQSKQTGRDRVSCA